MRLARFTYRERTQLGIFQDEWVVPFTRLLSWGEAQHDWAAVRELVSYMAAASSLLELLPRPELTAAMRALALLLQEQQATLAEHRISLNDIELCTPIERPSKLLLLAGNYAAHIEEQGGLAVQRERTFPYVFMKPPTTTLRASGASVEIPEISPSKIDHEVELAVVIGQKCSHVTEEDALKYVFGYTVINDLSDRGFQPNTNRQDRPKDGFFDWLHGKWHDGFCPCGPCVLVNHAELDPQAFQLSLRVDGDLRQAGSTASQVFGVAEIVSFISQWVTLEPGDLIATGTPAGVGNASGRFLSAGQRVVAEIDGIGKLVTQMV